MKRPRYFGMLVALIAILLLPAASRLLVGLVAWVQGCAVQPGLTTVCMIGGTDWGDVVRQIAGITWFALLLVPVAALLVLVVVAQLLSARRG